MFDVFIYAAFSRSPWNSRLISPKNFSYSIATIQSKNNYSSWILKFSGANIDFKIRCLLSKTISNIASWFSLRQISMRYAPMTPRLWSAQSLISRASFMIEASAMGQTHRGFPGHRRSLILPRTIPNGCMKPYWRKVITFEQSKFSSRPRSISIERQMCFLA